jgi:hypothetical protein
MEPSARVHSQSTNSNRDGTTNGNNHHLRLFNLMLQVDPISVFQKYLRQVTKRNKAFLCKKTGSTSKSPLKMSAQIGLQQNHAKHENS